MQTQLVLALLASQLVSALPSFRHARVLSRQAEVKEEYDYVIAGGGTSGLTVGDRLSENGNYSVLVIEVGRLTNVTGFANSADRMFSIISTPQKELNNRRFSVGIGKVVGGSSNVNGQVFLRGTKPEYDYWTDLSGDKESTWNWDGLLPYFKKGIHFTPPDPDMAKEFNVTYDLNAWGTESKIYATFSHAFQPLMKLMYAAMRAMPGVNVPLDGSDGSNGLFWFTTSQDPVNYVRSYARTGHWDGLNRENYELVPETKVQDIIFEDDIAVGVRYLPAAGGTLRTVKARKEVILAAGAVHTPQILQLSGIGPPEILEQANIPLRVELPGVGNNFQDHAYIPSITYQWGITPPTPNITHPIPTNKGTNPNLGAFLGLPVLSPDRFESLATQYEAQDPAAYFPPNTHPTLIEGYRQQQLVHAIAMRDPGVTFLEYMMSGGPGGSIQNLHPASRGTIMLNPENPLGEMIVDYRANSNPIDLAVMIENIRFMRRYMTSPMLAPYNATEIAPGLALQTDEELGKWAKTTIIPSVYHPVGTAAKMPREWGGVVDEDLLVYGVKGLSVVDASMMPMIVGATTSMTVYAVAEKAADLIKARA